MDDTRLIQQIINNKGVGGKLTLVISLTSKI
nr:MAG TPA: hypothetical protein [Caudoviricetes sp.]